MDRAGGFGLAHGLVDGSSGGRFESALGVSRHRAMDAGVGLELSDHSLDSRSRVIEATELGGGPMVGGPRRETCAVVWNG